MNVIGLATVARAPPREPRRANSSQQVRSALGLAFGSGFARRLMPGRRSQLGRELGLRLGGVASFGGRLGFLGGRRSLGWSAVWLRGTLAIRRCLGFLGGWRSLGWSAVWLRGTLAIRRCLGFLGVW